MRGLIARAVVAAFLLSFTVTAGGFYGATDSVVTLTPDNFDQLVGRNDTVWIVEFYAQWCGHCKSLAPEWKQASKALRGVVTLAAVDADTHRSLGQRFQVKGFPTIKVMALGATGKLESFEYTGGRSAPEIVEAALAMAGKVALKRIGAKPAGGSGGQGGYGGQAGKSGGHGQHGGDGGRCGGGGGGGGGGAGGAGPGGGAGGAGGAGGCGAGGRGAGGHGEASFYQEDPNVVTLTDDNFHDQIADKLTLVEFYAPWCGHCKQLKPKFSAFAAAVKGKVVAAAIDCTTESATCQEFKVQGYPTLKWFDKTGKATDYEGGRDEDDLTAAALERWRTTLPPPEVKQITDEEGFISDCLGAPGDPALELEPVGHKQLCFIAFLPDILDSKAAGRNEYLAIMKSLAADHKTRPFSWLWVEGGAQPALEASLGVGGYGYPALVALSPSKLMFATAKGAFQQASVKSFVDHVRQGTERVTVIAGSMPKIVSTAAWDGADGTPPEEDEFDLSDLMNEEL